jgi:hypothetical protein
MKYNCNRHLRRQRHNPPSLHTLLAPSISLRCDRRAPPILMRRPNRLVPHRPQYLRHYLYNDSLWQPSPRGREHDVLNWTHRLNTPLNIYKTLELRLETTKTNQEGRR